MLGGGLSIIPTVIAASNLGGGVPSGTGDFGASGEKGFSAKLKKFSPHLKTLEQKALDSLSESQKEIFRLAAFKQDPCLIVDGELYNIDAVNEYFCQLFIEWILDSPPCSLILGVRYLEPFLTKITRPLGYTEKAQRLKVFEKALSDENCNAFLEYGIIRTMVSSYEQMHYSCEWLRRGLISSAIRYDFESALFFAEKLAKQDPHHLLYDKPPVNEILRCMVYEKNPIGKDTRLYHIPNENFLTTEWLQRLLVLKPDREELFEMYGEWYYSLSDEYRQIISRYLGIPANIPPES
ncbi:MAG: hypothetical protein WC449_01930 [Candidatus Paceibacterota bacterium]